MREVDGALEMVVVNDIQRPPESREVDVVDVDISAAAFHMLEIPEREGVVVSQREEEGFVVATLQVIEADIMYRMAVVSVVIAPVADGQQ